MLLKKQNVLNRMIGRVVKKKNEKVIDGKKWERTEKSMGWWSSVKVYDARRKRRSGA